MSCGYLAATCLRNFNLGSEKDGINDAESSVETQQIVTFQSGGDTIHVSKPAIAQENSMLISASEIREHSIKDFLGRPVVLATIPWGTADNRNAVLPNSIFEFPATIWSVPMWADKLKGFRFLKADVNFQIQVNASPFDVGRLFAFWSPFDIERNNLRPFQTRTNVTGYPGVEIDAGNQMTSVLTIPYISMYSHIDQVKGYQPYGTFRIYVISQFFSMNDPNVDVTIYCWLSNVEIETPTFITTLGFSENDFVLEEEESKVQLDLAKMGLYELRCQSESESRSARGLVSGGAKIVGEAARMFANVPVIGEIAKPVAWASDVTRGVVSLVGLSKPQSLTAVTNFQNIPAKGYTHSDGLDQSVVLGSKPDNEVKMSFEVFGTKEDEMNIPYIISKPNWIQAFNWQMTDNPKSSVLFLLPIHAGLCGTDSGTGLTGSWFSPTHMSMVASAFRYWRGGVSVRLTAVKNQYYSGRLIIVYYPGRRPTDITGYSEEEVAMCPKWIWDMKSDTEIQLTFPFNSNAQWLRVKMHNNSDPAETANLTTDTISGVMIVYVDNKLRGPATVPQNFWTHVYVHGASDMRFGAPDFVKYGNYNQVPDGMLLPVPEPPLRLTKAQREHAKTLLTRKDRKFDTKKIKKYIDNGGFRPQCANCDAMIGEIDLVFITMYECGGNRYLVCQSKGNKQIKIFKYERLAENYRLFPENKNLRPQAASDYSIVKVFNSPFGSHSLVLSKKQVFVIPCWVLQELKRNFALDEMSEDQQFQFFTKFDRKMTVSESHILSNWDSAEREIELMRGFIGDAEYGAMLGSICKETYGFDYTFPSVSRIKNPWDDNLREQMIKVEQTFDINHKQTGKANPEGSSMLDVPKQDNLNPELFCIGELHNNLRPLTRRFGYEILYSTPTISDSMTLDPAWFFEPNTIAVRTPLNYFSRMYVFYRGSVRYKIFTLATNDTATYPFRSVSSSEIISTSPRSYTTAPNAFGSVSGGRFSHIQYTNLNPVVEVTCPYFSNVPIQLVSRAYITDLHLRMVYKTVSSGNSANAGKSGMVWKAGGDDFSFGYLVGCPLILDYGEL